MQSPTMTDNYYDIRADILQENKSNQSFENIFDFDAPAIIKCIEPNNISDFLGDKEESTEISSLVFNLQLVSISCCENKREIYNLDSDDDSKSEILQILKAKGRTNTPSVPLRPSRNIGPKNFGPFNVAKGNENGNVNPTGPRHVNAVNGERKIVPIKKISLAGKVLNHNNSNCKKITKVVPERVSNPINRDI